MKDKLIQLNTMFLGNWNAIFDGIRNKLLLKDKKIKNTTPWQILRFGSINDNNYPNKIRDVIMPPFVLFYEGNWSLINKTLYGIHGKIKSNHFNELHSLQNKCLIFSNEDYTDNIEKYLIKNNINHIVVFDEKINREIINNEHQLFISEYYTNIINPTVGQTASRIVLGLSYKNIFLNDAVIECRQIAYFDSYEPNIAMLWDDQNFESKYTKLSKMYKNIEIDIVDNLKSWIYKK